MNENLVFILITSGAPCMVRIKRMSQRTQAHKTVES